MAQFLADFLATKKPEGEHCKSCGSELCFLPDADPHPPVYVKGTGYVCGDCISDSVSEMIDRHPIGRPMAT